MSNTIQIQGLKPEVVLSRIDAALGEGSVDVTALADFVALIDWSGKDAQTSPAADIVGNLEMLVSEFADGLIDLPTYRGRLVALAYEDIALKPQAVTTSVNTIRESLGDAQSFTPVGTLSFTT